MDDTRNMDAEYARLSLLAGLFAAVADHALGRRHFAQIVQDNAWNLSDELLTIWKAQAASLGVPAQELEPTTEELRMMPAWIEAGIKLQKAVDDQRSRG